MRKIFFCLLIFISFQSFSQISIGFTGGVILPLQHVPDTSLRPSSASKLGVEFIFGLNTHWKIRTGLEYVSFSFSNSLYKPYYSYNMYHAQYLSIPVGVRYVFNGSKLKPFIDGALSFMSNIGHNKNNSSSLPLTLDPKPNSLVLSPAINVGVLCNPSDKIYASFMMGYAMQTGNVYELKNTTNKAKNVRCNGLNATLSIGYSFR
ncbi:outer membrane beta-barrel protein [Cytophaga aurantiaca]|uniref:outer membrane beta-barrel protein n=1 Tax=Cytophaga aurantiaca TaxID=29530 RepID=UPI0003790CB2|nr:outer membrane beta-barrel protein [Cytophaga aurantiaca]